SASSRLALSRATREIKIMSSPLTSTWRSISPRPSGVAALASTSRPRLWSSSERGDEGRVHAQALGGKLAAIPESKQMKNTDKRTTTMEEQRLEESRLRKVHWKRWGPYLSERQWGTVREDYSPYGTAWD